VAGPNGSRAGDQARRAVNKRLGGDPGQGGKPKAFHTFVTIPALLAGRVGSGTVPWLASGS